MGTTDEALRQPAAAVPTRIRRTHHWRRWALGVLVALVVVIVVVVVAMRGFVSEPAPAPLALPAPSETTRVEPLDGDWAVGAGSVGGFRVFQSGFGESGDTVGRTEAVTGTVVVAGDRVTSASFEINVASLTVDGKPQPQIAASLDTESFPAATFTLTEPMALDLGLASGETVAGEIAGALTLRGASHPVTFAVSERRDGSALQIVGSTPIEFSQWGIIRPTGYGILGSVADHGVAEVLLVLRRG